MIVIGAPRSAHVEEVCVETGDQVEPGDKIARMRTDDAMLSLARLDLIASVMELIDQDIEDPSLERFHMGSTESLRIAAEFREEHKRNVDKRISVGIGTTEDAIIPTAHSSIAASAARMGVLASDLYSVSKGIRLDLQSLSRANIESERDLLTREIEAAVIVAPSTGRIDLAVAAGSFVKIGQPVAMLSPLDR